MEKKTLIILISLTVLSPFAAKAAWGFFLKKTSGVTILKSVAPVKKMLLRGKIVSMQALKLPSNYFSDVRKIDLSDLINLTNHFDKQLKWKRILEVTGRESVDSIKNSVSADFVQRNFHDEISWYY